MSSKEELKQELKQLIKDKEDIEQEIDNLSDKIEQFKHLDLDNIVDEDGFPRKGLDYVTLKEYKELKIKRIGILTRKIK